MSKVALVTGATRGLGAAVAEILAPDYHVLALGRTVGGLEGLDDRIKARSGEASLVPADITDFPAMGRMCSAVNERFGGLDLWVHTAIHAAPLCPADHIAIKDFEKSFAVNVTATANLIQAVAPLLATRNGKAIYCEDANAGNKFFGTYGSSKAAQTALFESWAKEATFEVIPFEPNPMPTAARARFFPGEDRAPLADPMDEARRLLGQLSDR